MIITQTPFRMSFFGGGTDFEEYFKEYGGCVISSTIDKYCYVTVRHLPPFFDYTTELSYSKIERVRRIEDISHPAIRNGMKMLNVKNIRLTYEADLPARSGLGTSSSFAVGMLNAFYALNGQLVDKKKLAEDAIYLERVLCNESGGWQDQIAASYGGLNRIRFNENGFDVSPIIVSSERKKTLNNNLLLLFTGFTRFSSDIQELNKVTDGQEKKCLLKELQSITSEAEKIITSDTPLSEFGRLLDYSWKIKRQTGAAVSTNIIDEIYEKAINAGAIGGKLLGAGGGGFMIFYVEPEFQDNVISSLGNLMRIPFEFENNGTKVIQYTSE